MWLVHPVGHIFPVRIFSMFKLKTQGDTCTVTRSLTLPKAGQLPAVPLESTFKVKFDLGGVKPATDVGKAVLSGFENVYLFELKRFGTKQDNDFIAAWATLGKAMAAAKDKDAMQKAGEGFQKKVLAEWNDFAAGTGKTYAQSSFESVSKSVQKDKKTDLSKARIAFSADELKASRVNILSSILAAVTLTAAAGPIDWITAAIGGMAALLKGYQGAWDIAKRRAGDVQSSLNHLDDRLTEAQKIMVTLGPSLDRITSARAALEADIIAASAELTALNAELARLEKRAKAEAAVREGGYLADLQTKVTTNAKALDALRGEIKKIDAVSRAVQAAQKAVAEADTLVEAERKGWDAFMAKVTKVSSDSGTFMGTVASVLKQLK